jgi:hypothetical protein
MCNKFFIFFIFITSSFFAQAQVPKKDTLPQLIPTTNYWNIANWISADAPEQKVGKLQKKETNDWNFLVAIGLLFLFGVIKIVFPKYINDTLRMLKQSTVQAKQIKEQLKGNALASILLDVFFTMVLGTFIHIILVFYNKEIVPNKLLQHFLCISCVGIVYLVKYLSLQFLNWVFQLKNTGSNYIFIVFFFNKVLGIILLPIVTYLLIGKHYNGLILSAAIFLLVVLLAYRYILSYISVAKSIQVSRFHFFLYLCTVEIAPLLLMYKVLLINFKSFA